MRILDSSVLSEMMKPDAEPGVARFLNDLPLESAFTTAITVFEIQYGLKRLPLGQRRVRLEVALSNVLSIALADRVRPFDGAAAHRAGSLLATRQLAGFTDDERDIPIAGTVLARGAVLATRNVRHFAELGVPLINPWALA